MIFRTSPARLAVAALAVSLAGIPGAAALGAGAPEPTVVQNDLGTLLGDALAQAAATSFGEISAPGAVMAVETPAGRWIATIGTQDMGTDGMTGTIPMTADVHQRIGSVTKTFTVTALLQLVDQGLVSLDDPISDHVPGTPNPDATLGQLAMMRSGIPSYSFNEEFQHILFTDPDHVWTPQQLIDLVRGQEPDFAPGTQTSYSNTNTILLGMVIEQVTGRTIDQVIRTGIIEPLGLTGTEFPTDATFAEPHAHGYTVQGQDSGVPADATDWNPSWGWAAGAMTSTLDDLLVYGDALVAGDTLLGPSLQKARLDSFDFSIPPNSPARAYGLGLGLANGWYGHTGELPGFNTVIQHHLAKGITLVVMANSDIKAGDCPADAPALPDGPRSGPCDDPAVHIADALADALGAPLAAR
jgi:D-alanyl-D-alanine carboxypeptidase